MNQSWANHEKIDGSLTHDPPKKRQQQRREDSLENIKTSYHDPLKLLTRNYKLYTTDTSRTTTIADTKRTDKNKT